MFVVKYNVNVDCKDFYGWIFMMFVCMIEEEFGYKMVKIFFSVGVFLNLRDVLGRIVLSYVCMNGCVFIVGFILKEDVLDINEVDNDGNILFYYVVSSGNLFIVEMLVDCFVKFGLDIDIRNSFGYIFFFLVLKKGYFVFVYLLFKKGNVLFILCDNEIFFNVIEWV